MRFATTVDVEETATGSTVGPAEVAWQMTAHEVRALGGLGWGGSLVLRSKSKGLSELLDGARACIPHEVIPRFDDSAVDLRCRLRDSDFLDDIHCLKGGKGPGRVRLNATCYPQPRRVTWSVVADIDRDTGAHGLYAYTQPCRCLDPHTWSSAALILHGVHQPHTAGCLRTTGAVRCLFQCSTLGWHCGG